MKTILLTGPARGLGLTISKRLVNEGYFVIGIGRKISKDFEKLMSEKLSGKADFITYDLENLEGIPELINKITTKHGSIYGLVNNAGIAFDGVLATMHATEISKILRINLEAAIVITKYACRSMLINSEGRVINISSIIASTGFNGLSVYAASKSGLEGFMRSLSRELGRSKITVNCVAPGYMETDMTSGMKGDKIDSIRRRSPLGLAHTEDVAGAVTYLLSKDGERITGSVITVDGGSTA